MRIPGIPILFALCTSPCLLAQQNEVPEEIIVIGDRALLSLRTRMLEAERTAYELFNQFNDEKRFDVSCTMHQLTGTRLERQICQPRFQLDAATPHARNFLDSYRAFLDPYNLDYSPLNTQQPVAAMIAAQQGAYQRKMRQVAEENPQFLEALIKYSETREQYEQATSTARQ